jgi:BlaI family transcriptional regulator, penicillinase repressor
VKKPSRSSKSSGFPRISEAELLVMRVLWSKSSSTANAVVEALGARIGWKPRTIQTLLRRLVDKKAVRFEKRGREYVFHPIVDEGDYTHRASLHFLDRFFGGSVAPFLACFLEREKLTPEQIGELRQLLTPPNP